MSEIVNTSQNEKEASEEAWDRLPESLQEEIYKRFGYPSLSNDYLSKLISQKQELENWLTNVGLGSLAFFVTGIIQIKLRSEISLIEEIIVVLSLFFLLVSVLIGFYSRFYSLLYKVGDALLSQEKIVGYLILTYGLDFFVRSKTILEEIYDNNNRDDEKDVDEVIYENIPSIENPTKNKYYDAEAEFQRMLYEFMDSLNAEFYEKSDLTGGRKDFRYVNKFVYAQLGIAFQIFSLVLGFSLAVLFICYFFLKTDSILFDFVIAGFVISFFALFIFVLISLMRLRGIIDKYVVNGNENV